jgi:hypothetical protein
MLGKLYRHKQLFYVMRADQAHGGVEEWLSGRRDHRNGRKCAAPRSMLVPLSDEEAAKLAANWKTGDVVPFSRP